MPVLEVMERDREARSQFRGGSAAIVAGEREEKPVVVAAKLQALSPKYHSIMNHIRIYLPEVRKWTVSRVVPMSGLTCIICFYTC